VIGKTGRAAAGAAIVLALGLGGCAQEQGSATAVGKRQVAQATPRSAVPVPSALPITAERSRSGAQEFGKYWFAALNYAIATGDIARLRSASDPGCAACVDAVTNVRTAYSDGGHIQGGAYTVRSVASEEFGLDDRPVLSLFVDRSARSGIGPDGALRDSLPAAGFIACEVTVEWTPAGWRVSSIIGDLLPST
jgi:hypothetical protein